MLLTAFLGFNQSVFADVLPYTPSDDGISYGFSSALSRINDADISTSGTNDYQVHPTNAIGKTLTMTFATPVIITDADFYNRTSCCTDRIGGAEMIFRDSLGATIYTYTFASGANPAVVNIANPGGDMLDVKTVELTNFQTNPQNFREIIFNGDTTPPSTPIIPDLTTDSGTNTTDNITNDNTPSFTLSCTEVDSTLTLTVNAVDVLTYACTSIGLPGVNLLSPVFAEGDHVVTYTETDAFGNESADSPALTMTVDSIAPTGLALSADTTGAYTVDTPNLVFSATDSGSGIEGYEVSIDGGAFSAQTSPYNPTIPTATSHTVVVRATDIAGNISTTTIQFPPMVTITSPTTLANTAITDTTILVTGPNNITSVTDTSGISSALDCGVLPAASPVSCTIQIDTTGTLVIEAIDTTAATGSNTRDYVIETLLPTITFIDDVAAGPVTSDTVTVTAADSSGIDTLGYVTTTNAVCDATSYAAGTETIFTSGTTIISETTEASNGLYVCIQATDLAGNTNYLGSAEDFNIDITAPDAPDVDSPTKNPVSGTGTVGDTITFNTDSGATCMTTVLAGGTWSCTLSPDPIQGEDYTATATDPLGNVSPQATGEIYKEEKKKSGSKRVSKAKLAEIFGIKETPQEEVQEEVPTEPSPRCSITYTRLIKQGMTGNDVKQVQTCMNSLGYTSGPEDGIYGPLTYAGVTAYQRDKGLQYIDGIVGSETSGSLNTL